MMGSEPLFDRRVQAELRSDLRHGDLYTKVGGHEPAGSGRKLVAMPPVFEVSDDVLLQQSYDLFNALGDRARDLESQPIRYARERNAVVPGVLILVYVLHHRIRRIRTD